MAFLSNSRVLGEEYCRGGGWFVGGEARAVATTSPRERVAF